MTGSPGLLRVDSTGSRAAFTDDPLARFALASSGCEAPQPPGRTPACRCPLLASGGRRRGRQLGHSSQTDRSRNRAQRHGRELRPVRGAAANPARSRQARRPSVMEFLPARRGPSVVDGLRPGFLGRPGEGFHVEQGGRTEPRAVSSWAQPEALGYAGPGSPNRTHPAFHVELEAYVGAVALRSVGGMRTHGSH